MEDLNLIQAGMTTSPAELTTSNAWAMVEASPDGMLLVEEDGTLIAVNSQIESLFGFDRDELLGRPVEDLLPDRARMIHRAHRTRYRVHPVSRSMGGGLELWAQRKDGSEFPVEVSLSPLSSESGTRVVATVRDITDRFAAEAETHAVLHTVNAAQDGVFMFDPSSLRFTYINQGAVRQLGYTADELLAMTPLHIKPEFTESGFRNLIAPLLSDETPSVTFTTAHRRANGEDVPVEIVLEYPPAALNGRPRRLVAVVRDITDRVEAERRRLSDEARLRVLEDRERLAEDLHDLIIQRLFAAGMDLQSVQGHVVDPVAQQRLGRTVDELDHAIADLRSAIFHLHSSVHPRVGRDIESAIGSAETALGFAPVVRIDGDPDRLPGEVAEQLLPTLTEALTNVARHAHPVTSVQVDLVISDHVELRVSDDGCGLQEQSAVCGHGIKNMRSRAERVGGTSTLTSDDAGTQLRWTSGRFVQ